jgi:phage I-like protein
MKVQAIEKREDVSPKEGKSQYGDVDFADERNKKYPIDTESHIRAAWNYINKEANAAKYSAGDVASIKRKIIAAWKKKIDQEGPPSAQASKAEAILVECLSSTVAFEGNAPEQIVYLPKGLSKISARCNGKPKTVQVEVDANAAAKLASDLNSRLKETALTYAGFDHKEGAASFHPKEFKWDETRGIILDVEWSQAGKDNVLGHNYGHFSPTFLLEGNQVVGLPKTGEIGSLTNNPAFREIGRIAASQIEGGGEINMSKIADKLVELEVITAEQAEGADEELLIRAINGLHETLAATQAANERLTTENTSLAAKVQAIQKSEAEGVIEAAIGEGKIGAKDEKTKAFYMRNFLSDPEGTKTVLASMPANPVLNRIIEVKSKDTGRPLSGQSTHDLVEAQHRAWHAVQKANPNLNAQDAFNEARAQRPDLFPPEP